MFFLFLLHISTSTDSSCFDLYIILSILGNGLLLCSSIKCPAFISLSWGGVTLISVYVYVGYLWFCGYRICGFVVIGFVVFILVLLYR